MSVYLSTQKVIKDWIDYNDHMNVSYKKETFRRALASGKI